MKHRTGHLFKRGDNYYLRWTVEGKIFSKALKDDEGNAITTKEAAEVAQRKVMQPFALGDQVAALESIAGKLAGRKAELAQLEDEKNPSIALSRVWADYLASPKRPDTGEVTLRQYEGQLAAFREWMEKKKPDATMADVTPEIAEEYAVTLNHGRFSANTYNKHLNLLTLVFRVLKKKGKIETNPWEEIERKEIVSNSRRELTIDELKKVCQTATGELRTLIALGVYSGMRLGDCCTLRWAETDLVRGIITRIPNKTARKNKPVVIPIHPVLSAMLHEIPVEKRAEFVLPDMAALYEKRNDRVSTIIQNHFKACGIRLHRRGTGADASKDQEKRKRAVVEVGFHSLRHTFVSLCRASNTPLAVVESIVGHSNPAMTRHYTHVGELAAIQAVKQLPSITGDEPATQPPKRDPEVILAKARAIVESTTAKTWRANKGALLELLAPA